MCFAWTSQTNAMKVRIFTLYILILSFLLSSSGKEIFPITDNNAFGLGEKLRYHLSYGIIDAGEATLYLKWTDRKGHGRPLYHAVAKGYSINTFDHIFHVEDTYESFLDQRSIMPWFFKRRVDEGGYKISQDYTFHHQNQTVETNKGKIYPIPMGVQDMIFTTREL
jgi:hypothetical protein